MKCQIKIFISHSAVIDAIFLIVFFSIFDKNNIDNRKYDKTRDKSPMSPRKFDFPDMHIEYDQSGGGSGANYCGTPTSNPTIISTKQSSRTYQNSPTQHRQSYYDKSPVGSHYEPQLKSPKGSRSLEYGAQVSPKYDKHNKKFEYYEPCSPDNDDDDDGGDDSSYIDHIHSSIYYKKKKRSYNKSPNGVSSLDDYHSATSTTLGYENTNKRNSIVTDSTTNSGASDFSSQATTSVGCGTSSTASADAEQQRNASRRRHAINITSNPGYQVNNILNEIKNYGVFNYV